MDFATAAALNLTLFLASAVVVYRMMRLQMQTTREELQAVILREMTNLGRKVEQNAKSSNAGARAFAESALVTAQRAEAAAKRPVILVVSPSNDAAAPIDKMKRH